MQAHTLEKLDLKSVKAFKPTDGNGTTNSHRKTVAVGLSQVLADSYKLMLKIHNYHWNVVGPNFYTIHKMTEEQYNELFAAIDDIAERIRAIGFLAPGTFAEFDKLSTIKDGDMELDAEAMLQDLVDSHITIAHTAKAVALKADEYRDLVSADMLTKRIETHEKFAWLLQSLLDVPNAKATSKTHKKH